MENIIYSVNESIAYININRPAARNALNTKTIDELRDAFDDARKDVGTRVIILSGAGDKAFVAGAAIEEIAGLSKAAAVEFARRGQAVFNFIEELGKPVIAAVNGYALGGGCELAMACTLRLASETAVFGQPEVKLGLIPGFGGTVRLPQLVGKGRALQILLTGEIINAAEALRIGLVNHVVAPEKLMPAAEALAKKIIANAPLALKFCIDSVNQANLFVEASLFGLCCATDDMKEGTRAFLEKRPPDFKGL
jgi:enoyl-CoA hydratase/carnithine racemase